MKYKTDVQVTVQLHYLQRSIRVIKRVMTLMFENNKCSTQYQKKCVTSV